MLKGQITCIQEFSKIAINLLRSSFITVKFPSQTNVGKQYLLSPGVFLSILIVVHGIVKISLLCWAELEQTFQSMMSCFVWIYPKYLTCNQYEFNLRK